MERGRVSWRGQPCQERTFVSERDSHIREGTAVSGKDNRIKEGQPSWWGAGPTDSRGLDFPMRYLRDHSFPESAFSYEGKLSFLCDTLSDNWCSTPSFVFVRGRRCENNSKNRKKG